MEKGVVSKSMAALRREPTHTSEMVNQLLFGETFDMVERQGGWLKVKGKNNVSRLHSICTLYASIVG